MALSNFDTCTSQIALGLEQEMPAHANIYTPGEKNPFFYQRKYHYERR
jgi:hypothetical protein